MQMTPTQPLPRLLMRNGLASRHFSNIMEWVSWPETELRQFLKARKRTIAIQDWHTLLRMTASSPEHFQYRVVFGSAEQVEAEIRARLEKA
jgi:hypothetical protein